MLKNGLTLPMDKTPQELLEDFFKTNDSYSQTDKDKITKAWTLLLSKTEHIVRACGKPYYFHPLRVAYILATNRLDADTIYIPFTNLI